MKKLVIIAGPTASGKTAVSIELARRLDGEIISADSMQVYRGMDIGSAKVRKDEMNGIPHHLIDILDPRDPWNVVLFQQKAEAAALEISKRGKLPFLVGGTGFYIQALLYGIDFTKTEEDSAFRREMEAIARSNGPLALHELLRKEDPEAARRRFTRTISSGSSARSNSKDRPGSAFPCTMKPSIRSALCMTQSFLFCHRRGKCFTGESTSAWTG